MLNLIRSNLLVFSFILKEIYILIFKNLSPFVVMEILCCVILSRRLYSFVCFGVLLMWLVTVIVLYVELMFVRVVGSGGPVSLFSDASAVTQRRR